MNPWLRFSPPRRIMEEFLEIFKSEQCLWNASSPDYRNVFVREKAYSKLLDKIKIIEPNANKKSVINKIKYLRWSYKKYRLKYENSLKSKKSARRIEPPKLWYYNQLSFLADQERSMKSTANRTMEVNTSSEVQYPTTLPVVDSVQHAYDPILYRDTSSPPSAQELTGNTYEFTGNTYEFTGDTYESTENPYESTEDTYKFTGDTYEFSGNTYEFNGKSYESTGITYESFGNTHESTGNTHSTYLQIADPTLTFESNESNGGEPGAVLQNKIPVSENDQLLHPSCQEDQYESFGKSVAVKLRLENMPTGNLTNDILFEAETDSINNNDLNMNDLNTNDLLSQDDLRVCKTRAQVCYLNCIRMVVQLYFNDIWTDRVRRQLSNIYNSVTIE